MYSFAFTAWNQLHAARKSFARWLSTVSCSATYTLVHVCCGNTRYRRAYLRRQKRVHSTFPLLFSPFPWTQPERTPAVRALSSPPLPSSWKNNYPVSRTVSARGPRVLASLACKLASTRSRNPPTRPVTAPLYRGKRGLSTNLWWSLSLDESSRSVASTIGLSFLGDCFLRSVNVWWKNSSGL